MTTARWCFFRLASTSLSSALCSSEADDFICLLRPRRVWVRAFALAYRRTSIAMCFLTSPGENGRRNGISSWKCLGIAIAAPLRGFEACIPGQFFDQICGTCFLLPLCRVISFGVLLFLKIFRPLSEWYANLCRTPI